MRKFISVFITGLLLAGVAFAGLETGTYISDLVITNPTGTDPKSEGDNHVRLLKSTIKATFPNLDGAMTSTQAELNLLDGATVTTVEINYSNGTVPGTVVNSAVLAVDANKALDELTITDLKLGASGSGVSVTSTSAELNVLDGIPGTLTATELGYVDGVTSALQTQINTLTTEKATYASPALTGAPTAPTAATITDTTQIATTAFVNNVSTNAALPSQSGNDTAILTTNGTDASWSLTYNTAVLMTKAQNLSNLYNTATARTNLGVYSTSEVYAKAETYTQAEVDAIVGYQLLATKTPSAAAEVEFDGDFSSSYDEYVVIADYAGSVQANTFLTYKVGSYLSANYSFGYRRFNAYTTPVQALSGTSSTVNITLDSGVSTGRNTLELKIHSPLDTSAETIAEWNATEVSSGLVMKTDGAGSHTSTGAVTAIKITRSTGTITGTFRLYGLKI